MQTTTANVLYGNGTEVTLSQAETLAQHFLQSKSPSTAITITNAETIVNNGKPYFHVINANKGFAIIACDSIYPPLLAYDKVSNFTVTKNVNAGLGRWLIKHAYELDYMRTHKSAYTDSIAAVNKLLWLALGGQNINRIVKTTTNAGGIRGAMLNGPPSSTVTTVTGSSVISNIVGPFCATNWAQTLPFNEYCPETGTVVDLAGCVPVAMAQVMYFWQKPTTYKWSIMPVPPLPVYNTSEQPGFDEIARLIHNIGISPTSDGQFVTYGTSGSGAWPEFIPYVFGGFGYYHVTNAGSPGGPNQDISVGSGPQDNTYSTLIVNEIMSNNRPCIISGYPSEYALLGFFWATGEGHTWVCDGDDQQVLLTTYTVTTTTYVGPTPTVKTSTYTTSQVIDDYLHMNWGQGNAGGWANGWYNSTVNYTQPDPSQSDFNYFQTITYDIYPS